MEFKDTNYCLALKSRCTLHKLVFNYLDQRKLNGLDSKTKKKVRDASKKFFIEKLEGVKSLRLKKKPHLKVHWDLEKVFSV